MKLNTGGGTTVVGLLIAQSSLEDGSSPVAHLVPSAYLAEQVRREADFLGIVVADDPQADRFMANEAALVDTLQKLVNGLSVFGVGGSMPKPPCFGVGTVVIHDTHTHARQRPKTKSVTPMRDCITTETWTR